jgi:hypothetical protein
MQGPGKLGITEPVDLLCPSLGVEGAPAGVRKSRVHHEFTDSRGDLLESGKEFLAR